MQVSSQGVTVVALLADPDAPTEIAQRMAQSLPARLTDKSGRGRRFGVEVVSEPLTSGTEDPPTLMRRIRDRGSAENWDIVVALTDRPLHSHGRKLVVNLSHEHGLALLSLPSLGACGYRQGPGGPWKKPCSACSGRRAVPRRGVVRVVRRQLLPRRRQIWFFLVASALAGSQVHWWIWARAVVETLLTSTHLPLWTATSW